MRVTINYPIAWLHDALLARFPDMPIYTEGISGEWAEVTRTDGKALHGNFNLQAFADQVTEPVRKRRLSVEERLSKIALAALEGTPTSRYEIAVHLRRTGELTDAKIDELVAAGRLGEDKAAQLKAVERDEA